MPDEDEVIPNQTPIEAAKLIINKNPSIRRTEILARAGTAEFTEQWQGGYDGYLEYTAAVGHDDKNSTGVVYEFEGSLVGNNQIRFWGIDRQVKPPGEVTRMSESEEELVAAGKEIKEQEAGITAQLARGRGIIMGALHEGDLGTAFLQQRVLYDLEFDTELCGLLENRVAEGLRQNPGKMLELITSPDPRFSGIEIDIASGLMNMAGRMSRDNESNQAAIRLGKLAWVGEGFKIQKGNSGDTKHTDWGHWRAFSELVEGEVSMDDGQKQLKVEITKIFQSIPEQKDGKRNPDLTGVCLAKLVESKAFAGIEEKSQERIKLWLLGIALERMAEGGSSENILSMIKPLLGEKPPEQLGDKLENLEDGILSVAIANYDKDSPNMRPTLATKVEEVIAEKKPAAKEEVVEPAVEETPRPVAVLEAQPVPGDNKPEVNVASASPKETVKEPCIDDYNLYFFVNLKDVAALARVAKGTHDDIRGEKAVILSRSAREEFTKIFDKVIKEERGVILKKQHIPIGEYDRIDEERRKLEESSEYQSRNPETVARVIALRLVKKHIKIYNGEKE
jgi:hypothetical protein